MRDWSRRSAVVAVVLLAWASTACADVPGNRRGGRRPEPPEKEPSTIVVPVETNFKAPLPQNEQGSVAKIVIPRDVLKRLLDQGGASAPAEPQARNDAPPFGTIVAGCLLALAMVSAGFVWRKSALSRPVVTSVAVLATAGIAASWAFADLTPPKRNPQPAAAPAAKKPESATIIIEITNAPGPVRLYAPR